MAAYQDLWRKSQHALRTKSPEDVHDGFAQIHCPSQFRFQFIPHEVQRDWQKGGDFLGPCCLEGTFTTLKTYIDVELQHKAETGVAWRGVFGHCPPNSARILSILSSNPI